MHNFWAMSLMLDIQMNESVFVSHEDGTTHQGDISLENCKFDGIGNKILLAFAGNCPVTGQRATVFMPLDILKDDLGFYMIHKRNSGEYVMNTSYGIKVIKVW